MNWRLLSDCGQFGPSMRATHSQGLGFLGDEILLNVRSEMKQTAESIRSEVAELVDSHQQDVRHVSFWWWCLRVVWVWVYSIFILAFVCLKA